ncbi:single-stranded DNA-binding protein [Micromonospora vinacea]|uniref:single-stranded DNA-binding protein n=1 Tax=Micromonospora vinacea TaxID=709878 RepID=UPI00344D3BE0
MFDTYVTIVGNVLTTPEWRRTTQSNTLVANFKVASTARRLDRDSGRWVDGNSLRVRVNCWRKLAEGVAASVMVGDPVVVCGRLYTRDWTDDAGNHRTLYELEAVAVGHDLSRGRARFLRNRPSMTTSTVEDAEAESRVHGEPTEPVPAGQAPVLPDDRPLDDDFELPDYAELRTSPFGTTPEDDDSTPGGRVFGDGGAFPRSGQVGQVDVPPGLDDELASPPEADDDSADGELDIELGPVPDEGQPEPPQPGRGRRGRGRIPQPA